MHNHGLATKTIMQMLPSTSLCIQKVDGFPDSFGQLWKFTDVYCIDIHCCNFSDSFHTITLSGVHVPDSHICVPPNLTFSDKCWISYGKSKKIIMKVYVNVLLKSFAKQQRIMQVVRDT